MKISILCPIHRWGGIDILTYGLERQSFAKEDYELIICDKLYNYRKDYMKLWALENNINLIHFEPKNKSEYHVHSSVLNECLEKASGKYCIVIGDYSYLPTDWISIHHQYNDNYGLCVSAPQIIYSLPKLHDNLQRPISIFYEKFNFDTFKILPSYKLDPKLNMKIGSMVGGKYWYNRNESFPTDAAKLIGGWDERYDNAVGQSNLEFGLRLEYEVNCKIITDNRATIGRILSYPIGPFNKFISSELDNTRNTVYFNELLNKHGIKL